MTYDDRQLSAQLVRCVRCGRQFYATHPVRPYVCPRCKRFRAGSPISNAPVAVMTAPHQTGKGNSSTVSR